MPVSSGAGMLLLIASTSAWAAATDTPGARRAIVCRGEGSSGAPDTAAVPRASGIHSAILE